MSRASTSSYRKGPIELYIPKAGRSRGYMLYVGPRNRMGAPAWKILFPLIVVALHRERNDANFDMFEITVYPPLVTSLWGRKFLLKSPEIDGRWLLVQLDLLFGMWAVYVGIERRRGWWG
jgi:hypothetical protein